MSKTNTRYSNHSECIKFIKESLERLSESNRIVVLSQRETFELVEEILEAVEHIEQNYLMASSSSAPASNPKPVPKKAAPETQTNPPSKNPGQPNSANPTQPNPTQPNPTQPNQKRAKPRAKQLQAVNFR